MTGPTSQGPDPQGQDPQGGAAAPGALVLDGWLRDVLRCPACGSTLADGEAPDGAPRLVCEGDACALAYPVRSGIPVLLVDEAEPAAGTV
ncbi:Trm112 family protein [Actinotalea subterranea]|uniref:Trm112 family protein n=1 Tax=Actinotalea subterranea TaxID=2607497 RepID=UPI001FEA1C41|nr:hypothetical protein [Actinotalea subterranea]